MYKNKINREFHECSKDVDNEIYSYFEIRGYSENNDLKDDMPTFCHLLSQINDYGYQLDALGSDLWCGGTVENEDKCIIIRTEGRYNYTHTLADLLSFIKDLGDFKVEDVRNG